MDATPASDGLEALGALSDPARRRLYAVVAASDEPVDRETAAQACNISRTLAAYHLDRLVEAGVLEATFSRPPGVGGPGAGRPAKRYQRATQERSVSIPPRDYALLAKLLAEAIDHDDSGIVRESVLRAAEAEGRTGSADVADLTEALVDRGYEPVVTDNGDIDLRNCPFHQLTAEHTELVCGLNHSLLASLLDSRGEDPARAELCPRTGRCCVIIRAAEATPA